MEQKKVLILSASAGTGHLKAAEALEKTFQADERVSEVRNIDALESTNKLFRDFYSTLYTKLVQSAPDFLGWWYKTSDEPWRTDAARHAIDRLNTGPLIRDIRSFAPDITVCTHFMPAGIISHLIARGKLDAHLSIVVTDFDFHMMWLSRAFHRYFVAIDETRAHLEMLGFPPERLTVSGIPIDPVFLEDVDVAATRAELGLDPDRTTLLISAGALGVSPAEFVVEQLQQLEQDAQAIVICGSDSSMMDRIKQSIPQKMTSRMVVLGFTDRMHALMKSADLFIGKPGGLTTSEALGCGLPMAIISPIPGQEERNSDHLLEQGIAIKCNELATAAYKIDNLLADPQRLHRMSENAKRLARPRAAHTVVETLLTDRLPSIAFDRRKREEISEAAGSD